MKIFLLFPKISLNFELFEARTTVWSHVNLRQTAVWVEKTEKKAKTNSSFQFMPLARKKTKTTQWIQHNLNVNLKDFMKTLFWINMKQIQIMIQFIKTNFSLFQFKVSVR